MAACDCDVLMPLERDERLDILDKVFLQGSFAENILSRQEQYIILSFQNLS
jgi:hypothetical protein